MWGKGEDKPKEEVEVAPDFGLSGKLAEESNKVIIRLNANLLASAAMT